MPYEPGTHADDEVLEGYSLRLLSGPELEAFEEHLLVCQECQDRLTEMDRYVRAMRSGAAALNGDSRRSGRSGLSALWRRLARPRPALAVAAVTVLVLAAIRLSRRFISHRPE